MPGLLTAARRIPVFYSFHFDNDVMRVQQIRNIGAIEENTPVSPNDWEQIKARGDTAVQNWIDDNMKYKRCVIVLIGSNTASRRWVKYEIIKAWNEKRGLFGIYIHNLRCPRAGTCQKGPNPFSEIKFANGNSMSDYITCHDPGINAYSTIAASMQGWVDTAVSQGKSR